MGRLGRGRDARSSVQAPAHGQADADPPSRPHRSSAALRVEDGGAGVGGVLGRHAECDATAPAVSWLDVKLLSLVLC